MDLSTLSDDELIALLKSGGQQGAAAATPSPAQSTDPGMMAGYIDQTAQGVPIVGPLLQKAGAAGAAVMQPMIGQMQDVPFADRYAQNLEFLQGRTRRFAEQNPVSSTVANVAGAVGGAIPFGATALGARAMGMVGGLPARVTQGAMGGAAIGGTDAALRGEPIGAGAGFGGAIGAGAPIAGRAIGAGIDYVSGLRAPVNPAVAGFDRGAVKKVARAASDDAVDVSMAQRLGPGGMVADLGPNLRKQAETMAQQPGSSARIMEDAVRPRFEASAGRITSDVDRTLGPYQNFRDKQKAAIDARRSAGNTLYKEAFAEAKPVDLTSAIQYIDDEVRPGISKMLKGGPDDNSIQSALGGVRDKLAKGQAQRVDAQDIHIFKMDLDDQIDAAFRSGQTNRARLLKDVRNRVVEALNDSTGGKYSVAARKYRSDSAVINAMDEGREIFSRNTRPDDLLAKVKDMSEAEKEAFKLGARDAVDEAMGTAVNDALAARNLFAKGWNKQKLQAVIGKEKANQLFSTIERENKFAETYADVLRGAATRGRLAAAKEFPTQFETKTPSYRDLTLPGVVAELGRKTVDAIRASGRSEKLNRQYADVAKMLTSQGGERDAIVQALRQIKQRQDAMGPTVENARRIATLLLSSQGSNARAPVVDR